MKPRKNWNILIIGIFSNVFYYNSIMPVILVISTRLGEGKKWHLTKMLPLPLFLFVFWQKHTVVKVFEEAPIDYISNVIILCNIYILVLKSCFYR